MKTGTTQCAPLLCIVAMAFFSTSCSETTNSNSSSTNTVATTTTNKSSTGVASAPNTARDSRDEVIAILRNKYGSYETPYIEPQGDTKPGQSAEGNVVVEGKNEIYLDTTPCESSLARKQIKSFTFPYKKAFLGGKACPGLQSTYQNFKITQLGK